MDTLAGQISHRTLNAIVEHFDLEEVTGKDGGPFMPLVAAPFGGAPAGSFRVWNGGDRLQKVVYTGITVEPIGLDSHMIFAFTKPDSIVPTFTLDSIFTKLPPGMDSNFPDGGDMYAFHLDLIPKCDLAVNFPYIRQCYESLNETHARVLAAPGVFPAELTPVQRAIMSPWMLAQRTTGDAYESVVFPAAERYLHHWLSLVDGSLDDVTKTITGTTGPERDAKSRALIFNREIDAVWEKIDGLLGPDVSEYMISVLKNQEIDAPRG